MAEEVKEKDLPKEKTIKGLTAMFKEIKKSSPAAGPLAGVFGALEMLEPLLMPLQVILEIVGALFEVMAGEILPPLMEALQPVFDFLIELTPLFKQLGSLIGNMVKAIMPLLVKSFMDVLKAIFPIIPKILELAEKVLPILIDIVVKIVQIITVALKPILDWLNSLSPGELAAVIYALLVGLAFFYGMAHAPPGYGAIMGAAMAAFVAGFMAPLLFLQAGGILTKATPLIAGEAGAEAVIPLDEWRDSNQELIWATEDNGARLDRIEGELIMMRRFPRRGVIR